MTQLNRNSKSSLMKIWVMYLNGIVPFLQKTLGSGIKQIKIVYGFEIEVDMTVKLFYPFILFLKKHSLFLFNISADRKLIAMIIRAKLKIVRTPPRFVWNDCLVSKYKV